MKISVATSICGVVVFALLGCDRHSSPDPETRKADAAGPFTSAGDTAVTQITAEQLRAQIAKLSDDSFEGRGTSSPGDDKARKYLVQQLQAMGYEPGGRKARGSSRWTSSV